MRTGTQDGRKAMCARSISTFLLKSSSHCTVFAHLTIYPSIYPSIHLTNGWLETKGGTYDGFGSSYHLTLSLHLKLFTWHFIARCWHIWWCASQRPRITTLVCNQRRWGIESFTGSLDAKALSLPFQCTWACTSRCSSMQSKGGAFMGAVASWTGMWRTGRQMCSSLGRMGCRRSRHIAGKVLDHRPCNSN